MLNNSYYKNSRLKIIITIVTFSILTLSIPLGAYLIQQRQVFEPKASEKTVAQVNNNKITASELDKTNRFFSDFSNKSVTDPGIRQEALKFTVEHKLLKKYAEEKGLLDKANQTATTRFNNIAQNSNSNQTTLATQNSDIYKEYVLNQVIKEELQQSAVKWKIVDYISIRYHFDDNDAEVEKSYKETVDKKILEYQRLIKDEESLKEAIKQRCQDNEINYLPYDKNNKIYSKTFNGIICREQAVRLKISTSTNPMFGDSWLQKVFENTKKGEVSQIIDFSKKNLGMYFIVYVVDEGGEVLSMPDLMNKLKESNFIRIY